MSNRVINIYFIRHALSCANVLSMGNTGFLQGLHQDPLLSNFGLEKSREMAPLMKKNLPVFDYVLSSSLLRAMETAHAMLPQYQIYVVPYVSETGNGPINFENKPMSIERQKETLKYWNPSALTKLEFKWGNSEGKTGRTKPNYPKFLRWVQKTIIPNNQKPEINIAVFTHSNSMKRYLKPGQSIEVGDNNYYNNAVILQRYNIMNGQLVLNPCYDKRNCKFKSKILKGVKKPNIKDLDSSDVDRCKQGGIRSWVIKTNGIKKKRTKQQIDLVELGTIKGGKKRKKEKKEGKARKERKKK